VTTTQQQQAPISAGGGEGSRAAPEHDGQPTAARLTTEQVWRQLAKASFAVLSYVTPAGSPGRAASATRRSDGGCTS
jgi:hypothetical protein